MSKLAELITRALKKELTGGRRLRIRWERKEQCSSRSLVVDVTVLLRRYSQRLDVHEDPVRAALMITEIELNDSAGAVANGAVVVITPSPRLVLRPPPEAWVGGVWTVNACDVTA